jgi:hypothetical protein
MTAVSSPNFTSRSVHINQALSNISIGYHPMGMVAEQVFPVVPVKHESDDYYVWDKPSAFRLDRTDGAYTLRADGTESRTLSFGATVKGYRCEEYALRTRITDRMRANQDDALQLEVSFVRRVQDLLLLEQELRVATLLTTTGNYSSSNRVTLSGTNQWNNASFTSQTNGQHSVIIGELLTGIDAIRQATGGLKPNKMIIPHAVAMVMANDPGIIDAIKYTHTDLLNNDMPLPQSFLGMDVIIPRVPYQSAVEGEATSFSDVWGKNVVLLYVNPTPGLDALTAGMIFRSRPWQVKQWREEQIESTFYEPSFVQTELLIAADAGYLIHNPIA